MRVLLLAVAALAGTIAPVAVAGPCDAYFRFDGDLTDSGDNGYHGRLVVAGGGPATTSPTFYEGEFGKSLRLDGETVMYSPLDLQTETCPQVTIAAWIFLHTETGSNALVSTGYGRGPGLSVGTHEFSSYAGREFRVNFAVRRGIWIFVAGTWDYEKRVHRIYYRHRTELHTFPEQPTPPQEGFWVGGSAYFTGLNYIADNVLIDEVRVWGRVLSEQELREVQAWRNPALVPCDQRQMDVDYEPPPDLIGDLSSGDSPGEETTSVSDGEDGQGGSRDEEPTPTDDPTTDDPPRGKPRPTGAPGYSSVAGNDGGNKKTLDLEDTFFQSIWWGEKTDRPCWMRLNGPPGADLRHESLSLGCGLGFHAVEVHGYGVGGMEVCNNDNANGRLKGIRIYGTKIESDGSTTYAPISDEEALTNCKAWSPMVLCPGDKLATGLVVHSNDSSGSVEQIVGLQLVCRDITVE